MPTYLPPRLGISQSQASAEAYASATASAPVLDTISIHHPDFVDENGLPTEIYCVNDFAPLNARLESGAVVRGGADTVFQPVPFKFTRPEESDGAAPPEITLEIDNVSREISVHLKSASSSGEPITVTHRSYLVSDTTAPCEMPTTTLVMRNVSVTNSVISATAGYGDLVNRRFPSKSYLRRTHPGLVAS